MNYCLDLSMQIQESHVSEHSWLSGWVFLSISTHLAHLAQPYFSLIFSAINTYNCSWFDLTNKKICSDWRKKLYEEWKVITGTLLYPCIFLSIQEVSGEKRHSLFGKWIRSLPLWQYIRDYFPISLGMIFSRGHVTQHLTISVRPRLSVRPSVHPSIHPNYFWNIVFCLSVLGHLTKWSHGKEI